MISFIKAVSIATLAGLMQLAACAGPSGPPSEASKPVEASRIAAVRVHADWCPNCRALDPKVEEVSASDSWDGVTFVRIDYTSRDKDAVFNEAEALGLRPAIEGYFADGIKTGMLLLIDIESQTVLDVMTHKESAEDIAERLRDAQASS